MEKARGGLRQGAGRPQKQGATQSKVTVFLGRDKEARELKSQSGQLQDTVKLILEHFR